MNGSGASSRLGRFDGTNEKRAASHYRGSAGARYFDYQRPIGELGGRLNQAKFENHIKSSDTVVVFGCGGGRLLAGLDAQLEIGVEPGESARATTTALGITCALPLPGWNQKWPTWSSRTMRSNTRSAHSMNFANFEER